MSLSVYGNRADLLNGLKHVIGKVEELADNTFFNMEIYRKCVIGKAIYGGVNWRNDQAEVLKEIFNIEVYCFDAYRGVLSYGALTRLFDHTLLKSDSSPFNDDQKLVLSLFTGRRTLSKHDWLARANTVYDQLMGKGLTTLKCVSSEGLTVYATIDNARGSITFNHNSKTTRTKVSKLGLEDQLCRFFPEKDRKLVHDKIVNACSPELRNALLGE